MDAMRIGFGVGVLLIGIVVILAIIGFAIGM